MALNDDANLTFRLVHVDANHLASKDQPPSARSLTRYRPGAIVPPCVAEAP
jgi:hypothetical protein